MAGVALLIIVGVATLAAQRGGGIRSAPLGKPGAAAGDAPADAETLYRKYVLHENDGGSLGLITGRAETAAYGESYASVPVDAEHGSCSFKKDTCDKHVYGTYQYVDASCTTDGGKGHGCVAAQGCRFCRTDTRKDGEAEYAPEQVDLNWCPPCVCEHYKIDGCAPAGYIGFAPGSPAAFKQAEEEQAEGKGEEQQ